jgi:protein-L-isoaspartate O-methyltransferase
MRLSNVHLILGDGMVGFASGAPYAGIISAAGGDVVPQSGAINWRWAGVWWLRSWWGG